MRILQAPIMALYQPYNFSRALRKLGHASDYMIWDTGGFEWLARGWDYNLEIYKEDNQKRGFLGWRGAEKRLFGFLLKALLKYDIFHFHSGFSLFPVDYFKGFPENFDLKILKQTGKKIFFHHWGCRDSRHKSSFARECPELCRICPANQSGLCNDEETERRCRRENKYGNIKITSTPDFSDFDSEKVVYLPNAIDIELWNPEEPVPDKFIVRTERKGALKIYHSFGRASVRGDVKGSSYIKAAIEELQKEGYNIELMFFEKVPNIDLRHYQKQADIVVDQLLYPWYGSTAIECMAMGKPVIGRINEKWKEHQPSLPVVSADTKNIKEKLRTLIENEELRMELGRKSRKFVEEVHDSIKVAKKLEEIYKKY